MSPGSRFASSNFRSWERCSPRPHRGPFARTQYAGQRRTTSRAGDQVNGEFTTDASGTLGITLQGVSPSGSQFAFDFVVEKLQLVKNLSYNLFPASFFTRRGCDVFFHGRRSHTDNSQAGTGEILLHELTPDSRKYVGNVALKSWNDLWF